VADLSYSVSVWRVGNGLDSLAFLFRQVTGFTLIPKRPDRLWGQPKLLLSG